MSPALGALSWKRLAGPVAFLLAVTVGLVVFHPSWHLGGGSAKTPTTSTVAHNPLSVPRHASGTVYVVRAGDTFVTIAKKTHVPEAKLRALNPGVQPTQLFIGQRIQIVG